MATNFVQDGKTLTFTAPSGGVVSGTAYMISGMFGIAGATASAGSTFPFHTEGVWTVPSDNADTFNEGEAVYWDAGNSRVTVVSTGNTAVGWAVEDKATPTTVKIKIFKTVA